MSSATQERTAEHRPMSAESYHAHPAHGASMLEVFRDSRRKFHALYVAKTLRQPPASAAMQFGTLVHLRLLEPERFAAGLGEPMPDLAPDGEEWNKRKKAHREAWALEEAKRADSITCDGDTLERIEAIAERVLGNWHARRLLEREGKPEYPIFWTDPQTGMECKCMVDWWSTINLDIKTTRDPSPAAFAKQCVELGYHRKRRHYDAGIEALTGEPMPMVHLAIGSEPPHSICVYDLDDTDRDGQSLGRAQRRKTMASLAECYATDRWEEPYERQIVNLRLPGWAFSQDDYSFF